MVSGTTKPSDGGCYICWRDEEYGLLHKDTSVGGVWVHRACLDFFGVDTVVEFERQYFDGPVTMELESGDGLGFDVDDLPDWEDVVDDDKDQKD